MSTSSARPDALDHAARGFRTSGARLHEAARAVWDAADAYAHHCTAVGLDLASPSRAGATVADGRDMASDLGHIAEAFRTADRTAGAPLPAGVVPVARTTDLGLSSVILVGHPSLGRELTGPSMDLQRRGAELGAEIVRQSQSRGAAGALALLADVPDDVLTDPVFAASVFNTVGAGRTESIVEELAFRAFDWRAGFGPLTDLARLWATATRSLDLPARAPGLDADVLADLLASAGGRNALRALTGAAGRAAGETYLRRVIDPLLVEGALRDRNLSETYKLLLGRTREGDPDAPMLEALAHVPDLAVEVLLGRPSDAVGAAEIERRTTELLDMGPQDQATAAPFIASALTHPRLSESSNSRDRSAVLRATYGWFESNGPGRVTEPLAQLLADTLATDIDFYLARADTVRRGDMTRAFEGITRFELPWMTALLAFEHHGIGLVQESLHGTTDARVSALADLNRLEDAFEAAAERTDRPVDRASGWFDAIRFVANTGLGNLKLHPVAALIARPLVQGAVDRWHQSTIDDPGDHEDRTRRNREGLRRRIWTVVATDPELSARLDWSVAGDGPDRHSHDGSRIRGVEDLIALTPSEADLDELAAWAAGQPEDLQTIVAAYMTPLG